LRVAGFVSDIRRYWRSIKTLDTFKVKRLSSGDQPRVLHERCLEAGAYRMSILFHAPTGLGSGTFRLVGHEETLLASAVVGSGRRFAQAMFEIGTHTRVRLEYVAKSPSGLAPLVFAHGLRRIAGLPSKLGLTTTPDTICAAIATYPARLGMLEAAVNSLLPQVDFLFVYLNNYRAVPEFLREHEHAERKLHYILDTSSSLRAAAKFYWIGRLNCVWLTCDDDIIYPPDYARQMVGALARHGRGTIVGCHGVMFAPDFVDCYGSRVATYLFEKPLERDTRVHMLGTGTMCFHSSLFSREETEQFLRHPAENDEIMALTCRSRGIPTISVARRKGWLQSNPDMKYGLYEEVMLDKAKQARIVELLGAGNPWPTYDVAPAASP
jgi:hypothetical protein